MTLIAGIHSSNPELALREIANQLERLHERTPRGGTKWAPSSVKNLLDRARKTVPSQTFCSSDGVIGLA